jgi:hypothetical protein
MDGHIVGARFNLFEPEDISVLRKRMCEFVASNSHRSRFHRRSRLSAFRVSRAKLREPFADCQSPFVSIEVLLTWATTRFCAVRVVLPTRNSGQTTPADTAIIHALGIAPVIPDGSAIWQMPGRLSCHGRFGGPPAASPIFHRREQLGTGADN